MYVTDTVSPAVNGCVLNSLDCNPSLEKVIRPNGVPVVKLKLAITGFNNGSSGVSNVKYTACVSVLVTTADNIVGLAIYVTINCALIVPSYPAMLLLNRMAGVASSTV